MKQSIWVERFNLWVSYVVLSTLALSEALMLHAEYYGWVHLMGLAAAVLWSLTAAQAAVNIQEIKKVAKEAALNESLKKDS